MSDESKHEDMTPMQRRFCLEYLKDKNGRQAAIRAGYSKKGAKEEAYRLLKKPDIRKYIRSAIADQESKVSCDATRVLRELVRIAFFDSEALELVAAEGWKLSDLTRDERAAIQELSETETSYRTSSGDETTTTVRRVKAHSKTKALEILAKHFNMFKEHDEEQIKSFMLAYKLDKTA